MNVENAKNIRIPEGEVSKIRAKGVVIWSKPDGRIKQMFDASTVIDENKYINSRNGTLGAPSLTGGTWRYSDYIEVSEGLQYFLGMVNAEASFAGLAWYNSTKRYISGMNATTIKTLGNVVEAPTKSKWIRFSFRIDERYNPNWETTVWMCENGVIDHWTPYKGGAV